MVPLKTSRPRLTEEEIPEVTQGLKLRLKQLNEKQEQLEQATVVIRCLNRLTNSKPGRPKTKQITWDDVVYYIDCYEPPSPESLKDT